jgi:FKBP-type peptidyl-prolyl cis-trans isomerase 2
LIQVKPVYIAIIAIILIIAVVGVIYLVTNSSAAPVVANGDTVSVYYTGTLTNGTVFDSNVGKEPLQFTVGANQVIAGFDQAVIGMKVNQSKTVTIPANEAYGPVDQRLIVKVPLTEFGNNTVNVGMNITESQNGQNFEGVVTAVNSTTATVDFNPKLAGQTLIFDIKIAAIAQK